MGRREGEGEGTCCCCCRLFGRRKRGRQQQQQAVSLVAFELLPPRLLRLTLRQAPMAKAPEDPCTAAGRRGWRCAALPAGARTHRTRARSPQSPGGRPRAPPPTRSPERRWKGGGGRGEEHNEDTLHEHHFQSAPMRRDKWGWTRFSRLPSAPPQLPQAKEGWEGDGGAGERRDQ